MQELALVPTFTDLLFVRTTLKHFILCMLVYMWLITNAKSTWHTLELQAKPEWTQLQLQ